MNSSKIRPILGDHNPIMCKNFNFLTPKKINFPNFSSKYIQFKPGCKIGTKNLVHHLWWVNFRRFELNIAKGKDRKKKFQLRKKFFGSNWSVEPILCTGHYLYDYQIKILLFTHTEAILKPSAYWIKFLLKMRIPKSFWL